MDTGDVVASTIAIVSLIATAFLAYRQTRMQARLLAIDETRQRQEVEARQHADVRATVAGTPTALQLVLANDGPYSAWIHRSISELDRISAGQQASPRAAGSAAPAKAASRPGSPCSS